MSDRASAKSVLTKLLSENGYMLSTDYGTHYLTVIGLDHERVRCEITKREHDWLDRFTDEMARNF